MEVGTTAWYEISTGIDISGNPDKQCQGGPSSFKSTDIPIPSEIGARLDTANSASSLESPRSELSVEQVETDITAVRTEKGTHARKVNNYKDRVHNMDEDCK